MSRSQLFRDGRVSVLFLFAAAVLLAAFAMAVWITVIKGQSFADRATEQASGKANIRAPRGEIHDVNGEPLVLNETRYDIGVSPRDMKQDRAEVSQLVQQSFALPADEVNKALLSQQSWVPLAKRVSHEQVEKFKAFARTGADGSTPKLATEALGRFRFDEHLVRRHPAGPLAGQLLGGYGEKPISGLEVSLDKYLKGTDGVMGQIKSGTSEVLRSSVLRAAQPGKNIDLTIDRKLQSATERTLGALGSKLKPKKATAIIMKPTGEILSMANWPRVDPDNLESFPQWSQNNWSSRFLYEPGSTFKGVTVAAALQAKSITPDTRFDVPQSIMVPDVAKPIQDVHPHGVESWTAGDIISRSSNVGALLIGKQLGSEKFDGYMRKFGFGASTGIEVSEETGVLPKLSEYSGSTLATLSIGYGQLVTPLQIASFYATLANGGVWNEPTLISKIDGQKPERAAGKRVVGSQVSVRMRQMLTGVFNEGGTAAAVKVPGYELAGKTGTSNARDPETNKYIEGQNVVSLVGFAPAKSPKLVMIVVADRPDRTGSTGAEVAGPAFADITRFALRYLKIPPS